MVHQREAISRLAAYNQGAGAGDEVVFVWRSCEAYPILVRVDEIVTERTRVVTALRASGWRVSDSQGNFVWLRTGEGTDRVNAMFVQAGILVRAFAGEGLRVTIGTAKQNDRFLVAAAAAFLPVIA